MVNASVPITTFTLPLADAVYLARAVLPAVSKEDVTPVLTGSFWRFEDGKVTALSTDRYRVHRAVIDSSFEGSAQALIPSRALRWLVSNASFFGRVRRMIVNPVLTVTVATAEGWKPNADPDKVAHEGPRGKITFSISQNESTDADSLTLTVDLITGNYPPVGRLLDEALKAERIAPVGLTNFEQVTGVSALADNRESGRVEFVQTSTRPNVSGQMIVSFRRGVALIQQASK